MPPSPGTFKTLSMAGRGITLCVLRRARGQKENRFTQGKLRGRIIVFEMEGESDEAAIARHVRDAGSRTDGVGGMIPGSALASSLWRRFT